MCITQYCLQASALWKAFFSKPLLRNSQQERVFPETVLPWSRGRESLQLYIHWLCGTLPEQKSQLALEVALCSLCHSSGNPANYLLIRKNKLVQSKHTTKQIKQNSIIITISGGGRGWGSPQNDWLFNFVCLQCLFLRSVKSSLLQPVIFDLM